MHSESTGSGFKSPGDHPNTGDRRQLTCMCGRRCDPQPGRDSNGFLQTRDQTVTASTPQRKLPRLSRTLGVTYPQPIGPDCDNSPPPLSRRPCSRRHPLTAPAVIPRAPALWGGVASHLFGQWTTGLHAGFSAKGLNGPTVYAKMFSASCGVSLHNVALGQNPFPRPSLKGIPVDREGITSDQCPEAAN